MIIVAIYKCCGCGYAYKGNPGAQPDCPKCGSEYIEWLNYEELNKKHFHN